MGTPEENLLKEIFPSPDDNPLPDFNDLVRESFAAQEAFDRWDNGMTRAPWPQTEARKCTLDEVSDEWSAANVKLIRYVLKYGERLLTMEEHIDEESHP